MLNPIELLKDDHEKVKKLFEQIADTSNQAEKTREKLFATIETELKVHTTIEEEVLYPALRKAAKNDEQCRLYFEAVEEHNAVDLLLPSVREAPFGSNEFAAKVKVLKEIVEHHVEEEEDEMFPLVKKLFSKEQLAEIGERLDARKKELMAKGM
jgi:iron-sulfur cluster repair protein YtfE (RIC family)